MNPLRVLALVEATTVTGPAKNLIRFCDPDEVIDQTRRLLAVRLPKERWEIRFADAEKRGFELPAS